MTPATIETLRALGLASLRHIHRPDPGIGDHQHTISGHRHDLGIMDGCFVGLGDTEASALAALVAKVNAHDDAPRCECCGQEVRK